MWLNQMNGYLNCLRLWNEFNILPWLEKRVRWQHFIKLNKINNYLLVTAIYVVLNASHQRQIHKSLWIYFHNWLCLVQSQPVVSTNSLFVDSFEYHKAWKKRLASQSSVCESHQIKGCTDMCIMSDADDHYYWINSYQIAVNF